MRINAHPTNALKTENNMQTHAFRMQLNPGMKAEYQRRHDEIWPELVVALKAAGISDYWIFLDEQTHSLFAVLKATEDHGMDDLPKLPIMRKWWDYMADVMLVEPDNKPQQWALTPVFHLE